MQLINNAWSVIWASATTWVGQVLGWALIFYAYVNTSNADIQATLHFTAWSQWVPWIIGLATAFGIPIARGVKQQAVTNAANK
jgi:hypothetical protein